MPNQVSRILSQNVMESCGEGIGLRMEGIKFGIVAYAYSSALGIVLVSEVRKLILPRQSEVYSLGKLPRLVQWKAVP